MVVGAGTMGAGIAQALALAGVAVVMYDTDSAAIERGRTTIQNSLDKFVAKGKLTSEDAAGALGRLTTATDLEAGRDVDMVIEAIVENLAVKKDLFAKLDSACSERTLLLTNTSSLSVTDMANATGPDRRAKVVGMHFFNPVALMKLVEVVRTPFTSESAFEAVWSLAQRCGKTPVETKDTPGFSFQQADLALSQ